MGIAMWFVGSLFMLSCGSSVFERNLQPLNGVGMAACRDGGVAPAVEAKDPIGLGDHLSAFQIAHRAVSIFCTWRMSRQRYGSESSGGMALRGAGSSRVFPIAFFQSASGTQNSRESLLADQQNLLSIQIDGLVGDDIAKPHGSLSVDLGKAGLPQHGVHACASTHKIYGTLVKLLQLLLEVHRRKGCKGIELHPHIHITGTAVATRSRVHAGATGPPQG